MLEHALRYAALGWPVFPCNSVKEPCIPKKEGGNGVLDATTDPAKIRAWWERWPNANIGFHVGGAGMMVVDLDDGHDMAEVHRVFEGLPPTLLRQRTPSGGEHLFYALADGEEVRPSASKVSPSADIRSWHSYVLLAPSQTIDGARSTAGAYTWDHEADKWPAPPMPKAAYRTDIMVRVAGQTTERSDKAQEWSIEPDLDENIALAVAWLESDACKPSNQGQGGNAMTYATAGMMRSYGLSEDMAATVMLKVYNLKCSPPWEADEIETPIRNAYRYATSEPGNLTQTLRDFRLLELMKAAKAIRAAREESGQPGMRVQVGRFTALDPEADDATPDPEWMVPDLLQCSTYAILVGKPGSFKTFIALDIGLSVALGDGGPARMWPSIPKPGAVVFAAGEGGAGLKLRRRAWEALHNDGKPVRNFIRVTNVPQISNEADAQAFIAVAMAANPAGYRLAVIDTAMRAMQGQNSNSQEAASALTKLVTMISEALAPDDYGCTVLVLHHPGQGAEAASRPAGSFVFVGDPDTLLLASRDDKSMRVTLAMTKQKDAPEWEEPKALRLEPVGKSLAVVASSAPAKRAPEEQPNIFAAKKLEQDSAAQKVAKLSIVRTELTRMLKANPSKDWGSERKIAEALAARLARDGQVGFSDETVRKMMPDIRNAGYELYNDGEWGVPKPTHAGTEARN